MTEYEVHQLMEMEPKGGLGLDGEEAMLLLERTHAVLTTVLARKLPKTLHSDLAHLYKDIDSALSYHNVH
jgi:hypothetical protein